MNEKHVPDSRLGSDVAVDLLNEVCQRHHTEVKIAPSAHGYGSVGLFLVADDQDERSLLH